MDAFNLYSQIERDDVLLAFKGSITSELLTSVLQIMETKMEDLHEAPRTRKKVFNVLVECLQNLYHHIDEFEVEGDAIEVLEKKSAIFSISRNVECYSIVTGNFVNNKEMKYFDYEIHKELKNAEAVDKNGFFVGNSHENPKKEMDYLKKIINKI